jgi:phosphoribosylformylglycinamidine synthase
LNNPEMNQPFIELGLKPDEYLKIKEILGRRPTNSELAMYSVMWSEHCSYKSSKVHLKQFGEKKVQSDILMVGIGENAGVVDIGDGWAATFKVESHNHPSYIEPYQGAATGVGGIVRDILSMGARPIAVMDSLRFGPLSEGDTKRVLPGIVAGVGGYGNCLGLPNIGGETQFDPSYLGNPLVNALCVGVMKHEDIHLAKATGVGNKVILYGARTGGDGIGGVSVLASETFSATSPTKRPSVQVGDPFTEKLLIEATLEMFQQKLVEGIQDLGGAGISCATSELASNGTGGMQVALDLVPLRDDSLSPEEILMSESQERMCAIVRPENIEKFMNICQKWDVTATVIGEVTDNDKLIITWQNQIIVEVPPRTVAHDGPVYERPIVKPEWQNKLQTDSANKLSKSSDFKNDILKLISSDNLSDKSWITEQYDRFVRGNTILATPEDAGMVRVDEKTNRGISISLDGNGRICKLDPYLGVQILLCESYRNVSVSGAKPIAVTNCLNFGSPEDPSVMWQFSETVKGLADGAVIMKTPVTGGNVSFYNQTGSVAILPTPVIGILGVIENVHDRIGMKFNENQLVYLLGETKENLAGSAWAWVLYDHLGGNLTPPNFEDEIKLSKIMQTAVKNKLIQAAHDISEGGLAIALAEMVLKSGIGLSFKNVSSIDNTNYLFSESGARVVVIVSKEKKEEFDKLLNIHNYKFEIIGQTGGSELVMEFEFEIGLDLLKQNYFNVIAKALV